MIGGVGINPDSIPKGGFVGEVKCIYSDGLGQVADSSGPKTTCNP